MKRSILASILTSVLASMFATACTDSTSDELDAIQGFDGVRPEFDAPADGGPTFVPQCPGVPIEIPQPFLGFVGLGGGTFVRVDLAAPNEPINIAFTIEQTDGIGVIGRSTGLFSDDTSLPGFRSVKYAAGDTFLVGPVMAFDLDNDRDQAETNGFERFFYMLGMRRTFGRISTLCMMAAEQGRQPFMMTRVGP